MKHYNAGIRYQPYDQSLYLMRGFCKYEPGDIEGARKDWKRLLSIGGIDMESKSFAAQAINMKGFKELSGLIEQEKE